MWMISLTFAFLLAAFVSLFRSDRPRGAGLAIFVCLVSAAITLAGYRRADIDTDLLRKSPNAVERAGYVSSTTCKSCHPSEYASWHGSFHRTMTQRATPSAVLGDFNDTTLENHGKRYELSRRGSEFWVRITPRGRNHIAAEDARVVMTTGSHHMQVYWLEGDERAPFRNLPFVYMLHESKWVGVEHSFLLPPGSEQVEVHWNQHCIVCHTTAPDAAFLAAAADPNADLVELGISCEACHGPGTEHVRINSRPDRRYALHLGDRRDHSIINPKRLDHVESTAACGQCHGIFEPSAESDFAENGLVYRPGTPVEANRYYFRHPSNENRPQSKPTDAPTTDEIHEYFWPDGVLRSIGREYQAVTESPCYLRGEMSCVSCHSMHNSDPDDQLAADMNSNEACLQCHGELRENIEKHTRHAPHSEGSMCYNCHMPHTVYGLMKAVRSHQVASPHIDDSVVAGRATACNVCHVDKTLQWTAQYLSEWYGHSPTAGLTDEQQTVAAIPLWLLRGDAVQRALAAWTLGWKPAQEAAGTDWMPPYLANLLVDPYSAVRLVAYKSLRTLPGYQDIEYDYTGSRAHLGRTAYEVLERWKTLARDDNAPARPHLLLGDGNVWNESDAQRILMRRDNRPVTAAE